MPKQKKGNHFMIALAVIAVLIIGSAVWSILASEQNVRQASDVLNTFYLEEMVGKRDDVLQDALNRNYAQLNSVVSLFETKDIRDQASLRTLLTDAQTLYNASKLGMIDEDGTVYMAHSTFSDASRYTYLQQIAGPTVFSTELYGAQRQIVMAVPVSGISFRGSRIVACFMQVDIENIIGSLTFESMGSSESTFIGLVNQNGDDMTQAWFDDVPPGQNLFKHIKDNHLTDEATYESMAQDFVDGKKGSTTLTVDGEVKYLYYSPVTGTDWTLIIMIRDNTVEDQLAYAGGKMLRMNLFQFLGTAITIVIILGYIVLLNKRNSSLHEKQLKLELMTESEKQLRAAYHEVETSKKEMEKQLNFIGGISNVFFAVYAIDLKKRTIIPVKESDEVRKMLEGCKNIDEIRMRFLALGVHRDDMEKMEAFTDYNTVAERLKNADSFSVEYHSTYVSMEWCRAGWIVASRDDNGDAKRLIYVEEDISNIVQERKNYEWNLKLARDEAEKASNAKTAFLFNMSHDIRTPLNAITGYTDIGLTHADDADKAKDSFRKIKSAGGHLLSLVNDILEMSRIESGKLELVEQGIDIRQAIERINTMAQALSLPKSIDFRTEVGEIRTPYIFADELHINEIIINLISNAVKYTPEGGKVRYGITQLEDPAEGRACFRFVVSDNGIGMGKEFLAHLFEPFTREANTAVSRTEGAGLGLSIVKNIVEIAGGTIGVESTAHQGSTFTVEIPFRVMSKGEIEQFRQENKPVDGILCEDSLVGSRILLVEDNEINREIANMILEDAGMVVEDAENGAVAVQMLEDKGMDYYDFILMDIQMPVMDGYAATAKIRSMPHGDKVRIIALSANAFEEDKRKSLSVGMNAHEAKPINIKELLHVMAELGKA